MQTHKHWYQKEVWKDSLKENGEETETTKTLIKYQRLKRNNLIICIQRTIRLSFYDCLWFSLWLLFLSLSLSFLSLLFLSFLLHLLLDSSLSFLSSPLSLCLSVQFPVLVQQSGLHVWSNDDDETGSGWWWRCQEATVILIYTKRKEVTLRP